MNTQPPHQPTLLAEPLALRQWRRSRGTILVLVLGTILVLSALITAFLEIERKEIILRGMYFGREPMRIAAYSALESTISVLNAYLQIDGGLYGPVQGWGDPLNQKSWSNDTENTEGATSSIYAPPDGMTINVTITDLTGCMPLDRMSSTEFLAMFDTMNVDPTQAQVLVDTYLDWTTAYTGTFTSDGAGSDYYEGLDPPYDPTYTNITDFNEFRYLKNWQDLFWDKDGHETPIFEQFKKIVTLHDWGTGGTNINTAPTEVLDVLSDSQLLEIDETVTEPYLWGQDGIPNTPDDMLARNSDELTLAGYLGTTSGSAGTGNTTGNTTGNSTNGTTKNTNTNNNTNNNNNNNNPGTTPPATTGPRATPPKSALNTNPNNSTFVAMAAAPTATGNTTAATGNTTAGTGTAATTASTTTIGVGFQCRLMKINVMVSLGDSHFLLSTIVKPNNIGTGVPTATSSSGGTGSTGSSGGGSTYTPTVTNTSGAFPFTIVQSAENYDIP